MGLESKHAYRFGFLKSEEWVGVRLMALASNEAKCYICGKVDWSNDAHHINYPKNWKDTGVLDLRILCRKHHDLVHSIMKLYPNMPKAALVRMIRNERDMFWKMIHYWIRNPSLVRDHEKWLRRKVLVKAARSVAESYEKRKLTECQSVG